MKGTLQANVNVQMSTAEIDIKEITRVVKTVPGGSKRIRKGKIGTSPQDENTGKGSASSSEEIRPGTRKARQRCTTYKVLGRHSERVNEWSSVVRK